MDCAKHPGSLAHLLAAMFGELPQIDDEPHINANSWLPTASANSRAVHAQEDYIALLSSSNEKAEMLGEKTDGSFFKAMLRFP